MRSPVFTSTPTKTCTLKKKIAAIQLAEDHGPGLFAELPAGAPIELCEAGFSEETVKVRCHTQLYFVFRQDIDQ